MLLDFRLPDLNGLEILQALADKSGVLPFAVVMLAEVGDMHVVVDAMKYGAHDFLQKSWVTAPEILERAVANAIEKAALQREVDEQRRELAIKNVLLEQQLADLRREMNDRRRAEEALKLANDRFTIAEAAANGYVFDRDPATNHVERSPGFGAVLGYDEDEVANSFDWWKALIHPEDAHRVTTTLQRVSSGEGTDEMGVYSLEYRLRHKDGRYLWVWDRGRLVRDEAGRVKRIVGAVVDISGRKQIENSLRESQSRLKLAITAINGGAWEWDLVTNEVRWSDEMYELFDRRPGVFKPTVEGWLNTLTPEDRARAEEVIEAVRRGEDAQMIYCAKGADGSPRWLELRGITLHDEHGRPVLMVGITIDVTERKLSEEALRESEARAHTLAANLSDGLIYQMRRGPDGSRSFLYISENVERLRGVKAEEVMADAGKLYNLIPEDYRARLIEAEDAALRGLTDFRFEAPFFTPSGELRWSQQSSTPRRLSDGSVVWDGVEIDITERKRIEEALRLSEERYRLLVRASSNVVIITDAQGAAPDSGAGWWEQLTGQTWEEARNRGWMKHIHPDDYEVVFETWRKAVAEREPFEVEFRVNARPGVRWLHATGAPIYDVGQRFHEWAVALRDITERKRAEEAMRENEEALRESEERLRLALEGAKAGVWEVRFDPYSAYWSKEYRDLFGFSETDDATNERWATRVHPDDLQRVVDANNELLSSDRNEMRQEFRILHPEHGERWILDFVRVRRDRNGRPISFGGINLDVTDRKRAEEALRASEERFRELVETISDVFWIMGPESQAPTYISPACERLWGRPAKELNGSPDRWFEAIHPEDRERVRRKYLAKAGEGGYDETYRVVRPDGSIVWVHDRGFPVCDEAGNIRHIVGVAEDITDRKRFEDELWESQRRYSALAEAVPQLVWTAGADGGVDYFNQRWYACTGTTPGESLGHAWRSLIHPDDRERVEKLWRRSVRLGEDLHFDFRLRHSDGDYHWYIGRGVPYREERRGSSSRRQYGLNGVAPSVNGAAGEGGKGRIVKWFGTFTDVHDLKVVQEALRESEEQARRQNAELENIYQATPVGLSLLDRDFRFVRLNETMAKIDGATVERALGRTAREVTPKMADRLEPVFKRVMRTGQPIMNLEIRAETPRQPGIERDWLASYYPVKAADGSVQGIGCVILDITERKRAEEALRESEERLRLAAEAAGFGLYSVNLQTGENYWSPELRRIFGLADDDHIVLDRSLGLIHPDDRERTMRLIEAALDPRGDGDGEFEHEFRVSLPDGKIRWALARGKVFFTGAGRRRKAARITGVAFDITKRREDQERLSASERRLKLALAAGRAGTWEWRIKEDRFIWSDEYYEFFGMSPGDLEPTLDNFMLCVHPDDRERILAEMREVLEERKKEAELEFRFVRAGGDARWAHSNAQLTLDESGEPDVMIGIIIDITERKQAEMEREDLLRKEREARELAEAANRSKDDFVAMVSHELRGPLNAMLGWSKILKKGGVDPKTHSHAVEVIERSARQQQTLIEDLLDMARIVGGKLRLDTKPVSLARVIEAAVDVVRPMAEGREIALRASINSADEVTGDQDRLQQVVWNLLSNAVKFTARGGSVEVLLERVGALAQITVSDTGRGIKAEDLPFIFDRFRQADSSGARRFSGLGLGLALVKYLVELHGGQVSADSPGEGKGSSFVVRLPVRAVRGEATPARGADRASLRIEERDGRVTEREGRGEGATLSLDGVWALVVDDEADARDLIETLLKQYGARVTVASSAAEALDKLRRGEDGARPDVLISDISMPDEDGYTLIERVRAMSPEEGGKIPAIALTALERPNDRIRSLAAGFSMHVPKPVEPEELAMVIANLTSRHAGVML